MYNEGVHKKVFQAQSNFYKDLVSFLLDSKLIFDFIKLWDIGVLGTIKYRTKKVDKFHSTR